MTNVEKAKDYLRDFTDNASLLQCYCEQVETLLYDCNREVEQTGLLDVCVHRVDTRIGMIQTLALTMSELAESTLAKNFSDYRKALYGHQWDDEEEGDLNDESV